MFEDDNAVDEDPGYSGASSRTTPTFTKGAEKFQITGTRYDVHNAVFERGVINSTMIADEYSSLRDGGGRYQDRIMVLEEGMRLPGGRLEEEKYLLALRDEEGGEMNLVMMIDEDEDGYRVSHVEDRFVPALDPKFDDLNVLGEEDVSYLLESAGDPVKSSVRERSEI